MLLGGAACLFAVTPPPASARPPQSPAEKIESAANRVGNFFYRAARKLEEPVRNPEVRAVRTQRIYTVTTTEDDDDIQVDRSRLRPQRGTENPANRVWDPVTHQWLPPSMVPQRRAYSSGGAIYSPSGGVTVTTVRPSMPPVRLQSRPGGSPPVITDLDVNAMRQPTETRYLDPYGPEATEAYGAAQRREEPTPQVSSTLNEPPTSPAATKPAVTKPAAPQTPAEYGARVPGKPGFVYPPGVEQETKNMLDVRGLSAGQKVRDPRTGQIFLVP